MLSRLVMQEIWSRVRVESWSQHLQTAQDEGFMQGGRRLIVGIRKGLDILPGTCLLSFWLHPTKILKLAAVTDLCDNHCSALVFFTMLEAAWTGG